MQKKIYFGALICFVIDYISKYLILKLNHVVEIIPNFFYIEVLKNKGAAFSLFNGYTFIFIIIAVVALVYLDRVLLKEKISQMQIYSYMLLIGGIYGNLLDRVLYGEVTDFLRFIIFGYNYPVFNIADICICIGAILLIIDAIRGEMNEYRSKRK